MSLLWVEIGSLALIAAVGVSLGWWLRGPVARCAKDSYSEETRHAREVLARLQQLALRVARDVGEHNSRVEEISEELTSGDSHGAEEVVAAITRLIDANGKMQERLGEAEDKLQEQTRLIESRTLQARTDALTGLANRRALDDEMERCLEEFRRQGRAFSMIMIDIDHFKSFNDLHGHQAGDAVLRGLAETLLGAAREIDLVARFGGEEFAMILPAASVAEASTAAERVRKAICDAHFAYADTALQVTASLGAAELLANEDTVELIERADKALYASKGGGRNCVHWHDGETIHLFGDRKDPAEEPQAEVEEEEPEPAEAEPVAPAEDLAAPPAQEESSQGGPSRIEDAPKDKLCDRTAFCAVLESRLAEWERGGSLPSVILVRVDDFSRIVSIHGQQAAETVLETTAQFLRAALRDMDVLAIYSVATFAVLLPGADLVNTVAVAERLREAIANCGLPWKGQRLGFTVSVSGAGAENGEGTARLLRRVEEALHAGLKEGGNCTHFHDGERAETAAALLQRVG